jgi:cell division protein FtsQ
MELMRGRGNRRKKENPLARFKLPRPKFAWRGPVRAMLAVAIAVGALGGALRVAAFLLDQPVRRLVVEGTFQRVTPLQVEAVVGPELEAGFLSVDLRAMRGRLLELDWVDRVSVRRAWPDVVVIGIVEHRAAARWGERGLLNVRGELFAADVEQTFSELPQLDGPPGSEREVARRYLELRGPMVAAELTLESLAMDARGAWSVTLGGGQEVRLGRRDVDRRLERFFAVAAPVLSDDLERVQYVDLRYTNGFAVGWRDGAAPPAVVAAIEGAPDRG